MIYSDRAKIRQKVALLRWNPSPPVKWKAPVWQDVEASWIVGITFSKRGSGGKNW